MSTRRQYCISAITMFIVAIVYLYVIDLRVIQPTQLSWDSDVGHILLVPPTVLIVYAWIMVGVSVLMSERVSENEGEWNAHNVHFGSKFPNL